ncbi:hypothetical protein GCM10023196_083210 [Actinoallomurus vinaceus]|uniref:Lipoprotein n=1 Tax=Actinoallomurus vinaceus TaxID=1080074 RepID=A0ABP8UN05_9ACTN
MRRRSAAAVLLAATAAPLVACSHAQRPYVSTCPPPKVVFVVGSRDIAASHCSDEYIAQPTETLHVGQRIKAVARAGEPVPFSDDARVLREVSRSTDGRTVEYQAVRPGSAGLDIHYGPPCPPAEGTGDVTSPRPSGTDHCALLPIHVVSAN